VVYQKATSKLIASVYIVGLVLTTFFGAYHTYAIAPEEELQQQINENQKLLDMSVSATKPLESEVAKLSQRLQSAQATIGRLQQEQVQKQKEIQQKEAEMADQYVVFSNRIDQQYRQARTYSPLVTLLNTWAAAQGQKALKYSLLLAERDRKIMDNIGGNILELQQAKVAAAEQQKRLASMQVQLNEQKAFFEKEIAGAKAYQGQLEAKIAELSARQREILAAKTGTAQTSVGDVPLVGDPASRIDYSPGFSPAFAAFSFGAPHFKGMSQYGAYGRAKAGQNYEAILKAYYGNVKIEKVDSPDSISVDGVGSISFEDKYLKGIAEMPAQWADDGGYEALKAQAIAARTYALTYTGWTMSDRSIKKGICATESCQVYRQSKVDAGGRWHDAVNDTKGMVIVSNNTGNIFSTMYASTSGGHQLSYSSLGHSTPSLWDTTSEWTRWADGAYEKNSPWFFKAWYRDRGGDSCGRSHPWLSQAEFVDILNSWVVRRKGGSDSERVSPLGGCWGGNPFSLDEMRQRAASLGEEYTSVSSVRTEHGQDGYTSKVVLQTNRGEISMSGSEFKEVFNLRAPGRIAIKSKLFSIEKK
jgi:peptidoglycan hydrolase-like amidase/peptidoglycan hydrolase CwlO-like protein